MTVVTHPVNSIFLNYKLTQGCFVSQLFEIGLGVLNIFFPKKKKDSIHMQLESDLLCQLWINWK